MKTSLRKPGGCPFVFPSSHARATLLIITFLLSLPSYSQQTSVSGTITDPGGETIPGVNILEKGTSNGAVTDLDGAFTLTTSSPEAVLVFSFVGFETQEIPLSGRSVIDVVMGEDALGLDEVVVVGYGIQRKSDVTGSISAIKSDEISRLPTPNVTQSLQGRVSGVQVTSGSGAPGSGTTIRIRGVGTLNNSNPLFVVDGMLLDDIDFINPNDVASIEVLKDASATAIYGSRGANGVIIVSTKQGSFEKDLTINVDAYTGVQTVAKRIDLVNAREFAQLANELEQNVGNAPLYNVNDYGQGTDWQDVIFRTAPISNVNIGAQGGSTATNYNLSVNYFSQAGVVKESEFERLTVRLNNQYKASDAVSFGHNISVIYQSTQDEPGVVGNAYRAYPIYSLRNPDGSFANTTPVGNPAAQFEYNSNNDNNNYRTVGNFFADVKFLKNFTFRSSVGFDYAFNDNKTFVPVFYVSPTQQNVNNTINVGSSKTQNWLWENTVHYQKEWDNHRLTVLGGYTSQNFYFEELNGGRMNLAGEDPALWYLNAGRRPARPTKTLPEIGP